MAEISGNGNGVGKVEKIVESTGAKFVTRFVVPLLMALLLALVNEMRSDVRDAQLNAERVNGKLSLIEWRLERLEKKP